MYNNHYDPNQLRAADGKWTDGNKSVEDKVKENIEKEKEVAKKIDISPKDITDALDKAQVAYDRKLSYSYGSQYFNIGGETFRVSDHTNVKNNYTPGVDDFRSNRELFQALKNDNRFDLSDKTQIEKDFKESVRHLVKEESNGFRSPVGLFGTEKNALEAMWRRNIDKKGNVSPKLRFTMMDTYDEY